jgi:hypothetical protein
VACDRHYRVIVLRKRLATDKGQMRLFVSVRPNHPCRAW